MKGSPPDSPHWFGWAYRPLKPAGLEEIHEQISPVPELMSRVRGIASPTVVRVGRAFSSHCAPEFIVRTERFLGCGMGRVRCETRGDPRCDPERGVNKGSH